MNRKITNANWEPKIRKALTLLQNESLLGNLSSRVSLRRFNEIEKLLVNVRDLLKKDPSDFIKKEFARELETERKFLIIQTLRRGSPRRYLKDLFEKQKIERNHINKLSDNET